MSIKVVERERDPLLSIWNHGTQISLTFCNWKRTTGKKNKEPETCFMLSGYLIFSCKESKMMETGHFSVLMKPQAFLKHLERNSKLYIQSMRLKEEEEKQLEPTNSGKPLLIVKSKQEPHICFIRIMQTPSLITSTWELLRVQTFAVKLLSTQHPMKLLYAILQLSLYLDMSRMVSSTLINSTKLLKLLQETWIESLMRITIQFLRLRTQTWDIDQLVLVFKD